MSRRAQHALAGLGMLLALALLASCGGGTQQIDEFAPRRLLVLGDEMSVLTSAPLPGRKYSTNAMNSDNSAIDCVARPIWHQQVAYQYNFSYAECNPRGLTDNAARIYAAPGAKTDDLIAQLERARLENGELSNTDLFTVLVGANDVIDLYERLYVPDPTTETADAINALLQARGAALGQFVNRLTRADVGDITGPKVIISTMPMMNLTPYAIKEAALRPQANVRNVLQRFSNTFNTAMRVNIINDGRFIGLVELDGIVSTAVNAPGNYGLTNVTQAVCAVDLPNCTVLYGTSGTQGTLVPNGNADRWLWASDLWIGSSAQLSLGNYARGRALGNPF